MQQVPKKSVLCGSDDYVKDPEIVEPAEIKHIAIKDAISVRLI
jgi:hypothetical protein